MSLEGKGLSSAVQCLLVSSWEVLCILDAGQGVRTLGREHCCPQGEVRYVRGRQRPIPEVM